MNHELTRGQLVYSLAGRDKGEVYVVMDFDSDNFVRVANGRTRTVKRSKRKNSRHLQPINKIAKVVQEKKKNQITDLDVRQVIDELT